MFILAYFEAELALLISIGLVIAVIVIFARIASIDRKLDTELRRRKGANGDAPPYYYPPQPPPGYGPWQQVPPQYRGRPLHPQHRPPMYSPPPPPGQNVPPGGIPFHAAPPQQPVMPQQPVQAPQKPAVAQPVTPVVPAQPQITIPQVPVASTPQEQDKQVVSPAPQESPRWSYRYNSQDAPRDRRHKPELKSAFNIDKFEQLVGGTWISRIGVLLILLTVGYFAKYAFEKKLFSDELLVTLFFGMGFILSGIGEFLYRKKMTVFAQGMAAIGIGVLYTSGYVGFKVYHLFSTPTAFSIMCLVTTFSFFQALSRKYSFVSAIATIGGYLTPALVSSGEPAGVVLLTYIAVLTAGTMLITAFNPKWIALDFIALSGVFCLFIAADIALPISVQAIYFLVFWLIFHMFEMVRLLSAKPDVFSARMVIVPVSTVVFFSLFVSLNSATILLCYSAIMITVFGLSLFLLRKKLEEHPELLCKYVILSSFVAFYAVEKAVDPHFFYPFFRSGIEYITVSVWAATSAGIAYLAHKFSNKTLAFCAGLGFFLSFLRVFYIDNFIDVYHLGAAEALRITGLAFLAYTAWRSVGVLKKLGDLKSDLIKFSYNVIAGVSCLAGLHAIGSGLYYFFYELRSTATRLPEEYFQQNLWISNHRTYDFAGSMSGMAVQVILFLFILYCSKRKLITERIIGYLAAVGMFGFTAIHCNSSKILWLFAAAGSALFILYAIKLNRNPQNYPYHRDEKRIFSRLFDIVFCLGSAIATGAMHVYFLDKLDLSRALFREEVLTCLFCFSLLLIILSFFATKLKRYTYLTFTNIAVLAILVEGVSETSRNTSFTSYLGYRISLSLTILLCIYYTWRILRARSWGKYSVFTSYVVICCFDLLLGGLVTVEVLNYLGSKSFMALDIVKDNMSNESSFFYLANLKRMAASAIWLIYGGILLYIGLWRKIRWLRLASLALLAIMLLKLFMFDLAFLATVHRMLLTLCAGVVLFAISLFYNKKLKVLFEQPSELPLSEEEDEHPQAE